MECVSQRLMPVRVSNKASGPGQQGELLLEGGALVVTGCLEHHSGLGRLIRNLPASLLPSPAAFIHAAVSANEHDLVVFRIPLVAGVAPIRPLRHRAALDQILADRLLQSAQPALDCRSALGLGVKDAGHLANLGARARDGGAGGDVQTRDRLLAVGGIGGLALLDSLADAAVPVLCDVIGYVGDRVGRTREPVVGVRRLDVWDVEQTIWKGVSERDELGVLWPEKAPKKQQVAWV